MMVKFKEYRVQTPTGARMLVHVGKDFAMLRKGFAPSDVNITSERLQVNNAFGQRIHVSNDGTFISPRMLLAICIGLQPKGGYRSATELTADLFFSGAVVCVQKILDELYKTYDPNDHYWRTMTRHGYYCVNTKRVNRGLVG